jgi:hypothetical protein
MSDMKERFAMSLGFTLHTQKIDPETNAVMQENFVNVWGGRYERLMEAETLAFQAVLNEECGDELDKLMKKVRQVAAEFGLETKLGIPKKP